MKHRANSLQFKKVAKVLRREKMASKENEALLGLNQSNILGLVYKIN